MKQTELNFDGETYDKELDQVRLTVQLYKVYNYMKDGKWRTLSELSYVVGGATQSLSARLRDLRKERFGEHTVDRRRVEGLEKKGQWEYRLVVNPKCKIFTTEEDKNE